MIFRVESVVAVSSIERQRVSERSLFDAGDAVHAGSKRGVEGARIGPLWVLRRKPRFVVVGVERDFRGDDVVGAESGIDLGKLVEAVEDEAGSGNDHDGKPDLRHDQRQWMRRSASLCRMRAAAAQAQVASRLSEAIWMEGMRPKSRPASTDAPRVKRMSRGLERDVLDARRVGGEQAHEDAQAGRSGRETNDAGG